MSARSRIEWTETTWNPTTGCDRISAGCDHCYALTLARRLKAMGSAKYQNDGDPRTSGPGFGLAVHEDTLAEPYRWRQPRLVFVNSMSDLFHARVPIGFIRRVFTVMAETPRHTYQVLTKRSTRLRRLAGDLDWPPNVWIGVSVENTKALYRVDDLRTVPAAVRFLSCEPLLDELAGLRLDGIGWVIAGGESGRAARPMHPDWARSLRDQSVAAGVPFFFKQWGEYQPMEHAGRLRVRRVGKHHAGRVLDGRTWDQMPSTAAPRTELEGLAGWRQTSLDTSASTEASTPQSSGAAAEQLSISRSQAKTGRSLRLPFNHAAPARPLPSVASQHMRGT